MKQFFLASILAGAIALPAFAADYKIIAPANPGGGWDQTARTLQTVMQSEGISGNVQVVNVPGAGGTIGLAQFASQDKGNPNSLIVGGYVMVGASTPSMRSSLETASRRSVPAFTCDSNSP